MLMDKIFKGRKLHAYDEHRGSVRVNDYVSGYFSQNLLANSVDDHEAVCRFTPNRHVPMYKL